MPRTPASPTPAAADQQPAMALAIPADIRADLLRATQESIETPQRLPLIKIMAAGAGLFEFTDDSSTAREFTGVILNNHSTNILWDKPFGQQSQVQEENLPACSSRDGKFGNPRRGFVHAALGAPATGMELIECRTCPYNQFRTGNMFNPQGNPNGKAVANQRAVYVQLENRQAPMELRLPATSLKEFDEYLTRLVNRGIPVQAVLTKFYQTVEQKGGYRVGVAHFEMVGALDAEGFAAIMQKREQYFAAINPSTPMTAPGVEDLGEASVVGDDEPLPF